MFRFILDQHKNIGPASISNLREAAAGALACADPELIVTVSSGHYYSKGTAKRAVAFHVHLPKIWATTEGV